MSCYRKLKDKSVAISSRWEEAIKNDWIDYYGFEVAPIPPEIWKQEKLLCDVDEEFKFEHVGLVRIPPHFNYNWHLDTNRGCCINMLLSHERSHLFFAQPSPQDHLVSHGRNGYFVELEYEPDTFYAFNSQKLHCVYNFEKPRYLFTCEFLQRKDELPYERFCEWVDTYENLTSAVNRSLLYAPSLTKRAAATG